MFLVNDVHLQRENVSDLVKQSDVGAEQITVLDTLHSVETNLRLGLLFSIHHRATSSCKLTSEANLPGRRTTAMKRRNLFRIY